jgi:hypothetical protein
MYWRRRDHARRNDPVLRTIEVRDANGKDEADGLLFAMVIQV